MTPERTRIIKSIRKLETEINAMADMLGKAHVKPYKPPPDALRAPSTKDLRCYSTEQDLRNAAARRRLESLHDEPDPDPLEFDE